MFRLPNLPQPSEDESEVLATFIVSPRFTEYATKALIIGAILVATFARDFLGYSSWASASAVSGFVAIFVLLLASKRRENWVNARLIGGYWKYVLFPEKGDEVPTQSHGLLRTVHIDRDDEGRLRLRGWREGDGKGHRWENKVVMVTAPGSQKGKLSYEYTNTHDHPEEQSLDGVVHLSWNRTKANHKVNRMSGWYLGFATSDVGRISYTRISKEEFDRVRFSNRKANG